MALIRLCYAAELPSPSDAIKALQNGTGAPAPGAPPPPAALRGSGAVARAVVVAPQPAPAAAPATAPAPKSFTEIVALFESHREARLVHHLMHHVHEVRCEPGLIEFRPEPQAPSDLAARVGGLLSQWTGRRWLASVSSDAGKPTLAAQKAAHGDQLRSQAERHALVQAIMKTFPGARLEAVKRKGSETSIVAGLGDGPPPAVEEYPADDEDIPESDN